MLPLLASASPVALIDWPSVGWTALLAVITFTCLCVKARFRQVAQAGRVAAVLGHVVIGYFGVGMVIFGGMAAFEATFPVPGGVAWEGPVAVIGGVAALLIGATTLYEHVAQTLFESEPQGSPSLAAATSAPSTSSRP
jgi:hypothetical protein